jgi:membrane-associated phospholipid phosphatase
MALAVLWSAHESVAQAPETVSQRGDVTAYSQSPAPPQPVSLEQPEPPSFRQFGRGLALTFTTSLFTYASLSPLLIGAGAAAAVGPSDHRISDAVRGTAPFLGGAGDVIGGPVMIAAGAGMAVASRFTTSPRFRGLAFAFAQGLVAGTVIVQGTKYATGRERPDGSDQLSFPSGHSADTFTFATVVAHYYGWKWGASAYGLAGLVALSRVELGKHWASDVVAGAAIGYIAGWAGIRTTERLGGRAAPRAFEVTPYVVPGGLGLQVTVNRDNATTGKRR